MTKPPTGEEVLEITRKNIKRLKSEIAQLNRKIRKPGQSLCTVASYRGELEITKVALEVMQVILIAVPIVVGEEASERACCEKCLRCGASIKFGSMSKHMLHHDIVD